MQKEYEKYLIELPEQVQLAVANAKVEEKLRKLAKDYHLHLDKWAILEEEIMLTVVGKKEGSQMSANISAATGVPLPIAQKMVDDIAISIFKPIHKELQDVIENKKERAVATLTGADKVAVKPASQSYHDTRLSSSARKEIHNDPYRESVE